MKNKRQEAILDIIENYDVQRQEDLINLLVERGFPVTQATVSRDIRELKLMKGTGKNGVHKYTAPSPKEPMVPKFGNTLTESIVRVDSAENLIVVKTFPGMAQAVASCIDTFHFHEIIGCVAGDDAILVVVGDKAGALRIRDRLREIAKQRK